MNVFDIVVIGLAALAAAGGYRMGLVARALSWAGMALGVVIAARALPSVVEGVGSGPDPRGKLLVAVAVLLAGAFLGQALGLLVGQRAHVVLPPDARPFDRTGGAVAGVLGVLVGLWVLLPGMAEIPGRISLEARSSVIARFVATAAPTPPDTLQALRHLMGEARFPRVFDSLEAAPDLGAPPADAGLPPALLERVVASTVRVEGQACNRLQEGSGFVVGANLIVTNAHVVAGERTSSVTTRSNRRVGATVVHFDADRDLALLVASVDAPALAIAEGAVGSQGAVLGYPGGGPLDVSPFAVRQEVNALGRDLYDEDQTRRRVLVLASNLAPGDSGAALVDTSGTVIGVAFAIAPDQPGTAYALDITELQAVLSAPRTGRADTGPCLP